MTTWTRRGYGWPKKSLFLSKFSGKNVHVVKKDQNCVHVVIECPPVGVVAAILCTMG